MAVFLSDSEKGTIRRESDRHGSLIPTFYDALHNRVYERVGWGSLLGPEAKTIWWHSAAEYLSDAAMCYALQPTAELGSWLRTVTLEIVRKPAYEWVGPPFRNHSEPLTGHLETAHICWGVSAVYDLATDAFSESEQNEVKTALQQKGIVLCRQWISKNNHLANWRSVMVSGVIVSAVVLGDEKTVNELLPDLKLCYHAMQDDGSYGESLQYGNYLLLALTFAIEAAIRRYPSLSQAVMPALDQSITWFATSMFYAKPLADWGSEPRARAANFNDSAALFRPSGDLLLHMAARGGSATTKGLAKWLFETYYMPVPEQGPHDLATLGMRNDWGFLTLPLLTYPSESVSPEQAHLSLTASFSNGNAFIRDAWDGNTIVAVNGGSGPLHGLGHLHGDLNSFILVYDNERLLADPGHSCYRNLIHGLESSSQTHNTCTFLVEKEALGLQEDLAKASFLEQKSVCPRRLIQNGVAGEKISRGDKRLICEKQDEISVIGAEAGSAYGAPIRTFSRFWILAESQALFVIDIVSADEPVTTFWNWVVNNRDGKTEWHTQKNSLTVCKNQSGMKLFHGGSGSWGFPSYGFLHDAYHPEPNQLGEGRSGGGLVFRFSEQQKATSRTVVHAIALDAPAALKNWKFEHYGNHYTLINNTSKWTLQMTHKESFSIFSEAGKRWDIEMAGEKFNLKKALTNA